MPCAALWALPIALTALYDDFHYDRWATQGSVRFLSDGSGVRVINERGSRTRSYEVRLPPEQLCDARQTAVHGIGVVSCVARIHSAHTNDVLSSFDGCQKRLIGRAVLDAVPKSHARSVRSGVPELPAIV